jgi:hypothetical protein
MVSYHSPTELVCRETRLLAELLYYSLTTGAGIQTLGEEYCDILQVSGENFTVPLKRLWIVCYRYSKTGGEEELGQFAGLTHDGGA